MKKTRHGIIILFIFGLSISLCLAQEKDLKVPNYLQELQPAKSKAWFQQKLKKDPQDAAAMIGLANTLLTLQSTDSAKILFKKALAVEGKNPAALAGLGLVALMGNDRTGESDYFERARRADKTNPEVYCTIAEGCLDLPKQDTVTTLTYLRQGLDLYPKYARLHFIAGKLESTKKNYGAAANAYNRAIFFDPKSALAYRNLGTIHFYSRSYRDALTAFNKSIALNPEQILVYKNLGDLYYAVAKYDEAERSYKIYLERADVTNDGRERLAYTLFFNKKYKKAELLLEQLQQTGLDESILLRIRGYIAFETADYKKGVELLTNFFKLHDSRNIIASDYSYFAKLLMKTGNEVLAMDNFRKAIAKDSSKIENYEELAKLAAKNNLHAEAASCYKKMINLGADNVVSHFLAGKEYYFEGELWRSRLDSLMKVLKGNGNLASDRTEAKKTMLYCFKQADSAFTVVTKLNSEYAGGFIWKGRIQAMLDPDAITTEAKESYQNALILLGKNDPEKSRKSIIECYRYLGSYYFLGYDRQYKSDRKAAGEMRSRTLECFAEILKLDPSDAQAKDVLDKLKGKK
ncbi:MAG: tetratricopeptide repeat protein [Prolixibacteraceae bacterium]|jgi:tetratricopeptide (TPR) repeat protein|nr:tetratricopeptide repeat protein [Prolixibacteraceae bacterium]